MQLKQFIPSEYCLKCLGCCRFRENPSIWASPGLRLVRDNGAYRCEKLDVRDNSCRIYALRPLDCRIYPFLLVKRHGRLSLGLHKSCCFISENKPFLKDYADYLRRVLNSPALVSVLRQNPAFAADYQEDVEVLGPLDELYSQACLPQLNKLTLRDKPLVDKYLKNAASRISAYHFAAVFIWKDLFEIFWAGIEDSLCLFFRDSIGMFMPLPPLFTPLGCKKGCKREMVVRKCFELMNFYNQNPEVSRIENVGEEDIGFYSGLGLKPKLKDREYLYRKEDQLRLSGGAFRHKRATYNQFIRNYPGSRVEEYKPSMFDECLGLYQLWQKERREKYKNILYRQMLEDSYLSFKTALESARPLGLWGWVVKIRGEIKACSLGYHLNKENFCLLFEVCDLRLKGIAQFIFREVCRLLSGYKYINVMGSSDLANMEIVKRSYRPARTIAIYNIYQ